MLPPLTVAVKAVDWPRMVGPLFCAINPLTAMSLTVTVTVSGELVRPALSVTIRLKTRTAGVSGAVKDGLTVLGSLKFTAGPLVCAQP